MIPHDVVRLAQWTIVIMLILIVATGFVLWRPAKKPPSPKDDLLANVRTNISRFPHYNHLVVMRNPNRASALFKGLPKHLPGRITILPKERATSGWQTR